ncbi:MAG TPA: hypothetical protein VN673_02955, partial [Clostridia bacterium]|nr:hypothetical protein [Clostridia bacterium]
MKTAAGLALVAWLALAGSASADLVITTNVQSGTAGVFPFTPTWTPSTTSLIAGAVPLTTGNGNFNMEQNGGAARDVSSLTAGGSLAIEPMGTPATTSNNYVAGGQNAGLSATYTLPVATLGYDVTNITIYSGWKDSGRDGQAYNISYSTVDNPTVFTVLGIVKYDGPTLPQNTPSAIQLTFTDSAGGAIARNVAQIRFDFSAPNSENGWTGYGAITVDGTPAVATAPKGILTFTENQNNATEFFPTWAVETENLIAWLMPSTAIGEFGAEASGGVYTLTDSTAGASGVTSGFATCGRNAGTTLIYTLVNLVNGSDVTNIVVYSGWGNRNRDGQYYTISYSTVSAPTTFLPMTTVLFNPDIPSDVASANRVAIRKATGSPLAQNVHSVKFDFGTMPAFDNSYVGISEIVLQGTDSEPPTAPPAPY